jgi:hypothetical protein
MMEAVFSMMTSIACAALLIKKPLHAVGTYSTTVIAMGLVQMERSNSVGQTADAQRHLVIIRLLVVRVVKRVLLSMKNVNGALRSTATHTSAHRKSLILFSHLVMEMEALLVVVTGELMRMRSANIAVVVPMKT